MFASRNLANGLLSNSAFYRAVSYVRVSQDGTFSPANQTYQIWPWQNTDIDDDGWHDPLTDNTVLTVPSGLGITHVSLNCALSANNNDTGYLNFAFFKCDPLPTTPTNGGSDLSLLNATRADLRRRQPGHSTLVEAQAGDQLYVRIYQSGTATLSSTTTFSAVGYAL